MTNNDALEHLSKRLPQTGNWPICEGPGRNGLPRCDRPVHQRSAELCRSHALQMEVHGSLSPLRTRTIKTPCMGPGDDGGACGRQVFFREPGQDDGICKTHYEQVKRRGSMGPIAPHVTVPSAQCIGPGQDGEEGCSRMAATGAGYCAAHSNQLLRSGRLKPIRRTNTPDGPCIGPGHDDELCGRPMKHKGLGLCVGHYAQERRGQELAPLKMSRERGVAAPCKFEGCRYNDAPDGLGYCRYHWRQVHLGQALRPLRGNPNRGREGVMARDSMGCKYCPTCGAWKSEDQFTKSSTASDGLNSRCKVCHASALRLSKYGMSLETYDLLLEAQGGGCAICGSPAIADERRLSVDHDHACCSGALSCGNCTRGLLCPDCNRGLGLFRDNVKFLTAATAYLSRGYIPFIE